MKLYINFFILFLISLLSLFTIFLFWMNLTPGFFQESCECCGAKIVYSKRLICKPCLVLCVKITYSWSDILLLKLAEFDHYK